jgi:acyl dehydratase
MSPAADPGLFYEDFTIGREWTTPARPVTATEIDIFATLTGDDNPLHTDRQAARAAGFEDVIAHGLLIQSLAMGLIADLGIMRGTTIALLRVDVNFAAPTLAGDSIHVRLRATQKRPTGRPGRGLLWRRAEVLNQDDVMVAEARLLTLMRRRPPRSHPAKDST